MMNQDAMYIGDLANQLKLNRKTIRYYEQLGLMPEPMRTAAGYRVYNEADRDRLAFILKAKTLGLSLEEIGSVLQLRAQGESPCKRVAVIVQDKLELIDEKIKGLRALRADLARVSQKATASKRNGMIPAGKVCGLIEEQNALP